MIVESLIVPRDQFETGTGWELRPEGACRGEVCIPLIDPPEGDMIDVAAIAGQMGLPLVAHEKHPVWAVGPPAVSGRTLVTAEAPELVLPDLDGNPFELASLRGQKVVMVAWSPY
jgi:hypothetical protein